ncbi:hypothetical protein HPB50_014765 [Hyalomma asiaticum]|uniref:Uncharacterized protein n=1 Tax=Hyalomma asiaticum TaxID=266040 RepID=A0ACB7TIU4_HYAAI|nr:hypothetical protein HPB50_014765 [Hyalomma asiaticum]
MADLPPDFPPGYALSGTSNRSRAYDLLLKEAGEIIRRDASKLPLSPRRRTRRTKRRSPVRHRMAYYFTKGLTGDELHKLIIFVMKKVEACGFKIVRLVTDNHKVNVNAMKLLGNGLVTYRTEHPCDPDRQLFMSFDPCHVLKNVRSQLLSHDIGPEREISSSYIKDLYELQKGLTVKPVRFNSDPIESLFGTLRMSSGTNDMLDVRAALSGLEKILKTGIAAANVTSNVAHAESVTSSPLPGSASSSQPVCTSSALVSSAANTDVQTPPSLKKAVVVLQRLTTSVLPQYLPSLQISATVTATHDSPDPPLPPPEEAAAAIMTAPAPTTRDSPLDHLQKCDCACARARVVCLVGKQTDCKRDVPHASMVRAPHMPENA